MNRKIAAVSAAAAVAALTAACTSSSNATAAGGQAARSPASAAQTLKGVCPDVVTIQSDWWPQDEYGGLYRLLGANVQVDRNRNRVTGPLVDAGVDTGVQVQIRSGGPANGYTPAASVLYADESVMLGGSDLDAAVGLAGTKPVVGVFAPMDVSPVALMWDPATHPDWSTISDIGQSNAKVVYFQGSTYMDFLVGTGVLKASQVSPTYAGTPDQWKAGLGKIVQQGFLTNEVVTYQQDKQIWGKKVGYQLVSDAGYPTYPEMLTVRADRLDRYAPCLRRLVPVLQRATVAYANDPGPTNQLMSSVVAQSPKAYPYSRAHADEVVKVMLEQGIVGNGRDRTVGDFETSRVQKMIDLTKPIFGAQHRPVPAGLTPDQVATNRFIDPTIGLPPVK